MSVEYELQTTTEGVVIRLSGRIDRDATGTLDAAYTAASAGIPASIELDFAGVDYINSTGIALIVGLLARARVSKTDVSATGLTAHYRHIFEITRLSDFIRVVQPAEH